VSKALKKCPDSADFDRRVAKSRRKFDAKVERVLEGLARPRRRRPEPAADFGPSRGHAILDNPGCD
jgi:hypothetical protein